jgi:NAD(P)-dependent dehydrogenase (short-subunit alcohol dehydrogenase family)
MKTILITGANKGIGFETAKQLALLNYFVYLGSRNKEHGLEAVQKLHDLGKGWLRFGRCKLLNMGYRA